jgi:hypothetical protein
MMHSYVEVQKRRRFNSQAWPPKVYCNVTVVGGEVALPWTKTGGPDTEQHGAIEFPEYTAVNVLAPGTSRDALSGRVAADSVALAGSSVRFFSKVDPSMNFTVPLGIPPPPGLADTVTVSVVVSPGSRVYITEVRFTVNELATTAYRQNTSTRARQSNGCYALALSMSGSGLSTDADVSNSNCSCPLSAETFPR